MYHQHLFSEIMCSVNNALMYFGGSQNKQRLFLYTALTDWFL